MVGVEPLSVEAEAELSVWLALIALSTTRRMAALRTTMPTSWVT